MKNKPIKWKEVSFSTLQKVQSTGLLKPIPSECLPTWAQELETVNGAWLSYYGGQQTASTGSLSTSAVNARVDLERIDPTDTGLFKYYQYFYIKMNDGRVFQAGPFKDVDYGHHLRKRPEWAEQYRSNSASL